MDGADMVVADDRLAAVLTALGHACATPAQIAASLAVIAEQESALPRMVVGEVGLPTPLPLADGPVEVSAEDGNTVTARVAGGQLPPIDQPGYYVLHTGATTLTLAVAPTACPLPADLGAARMWGPAVQIPSLRGHRPGAYGTFAELDAAVQAFAARGAQAVAISPVHALFAGTGEDFSPYSPSSRLFLNTALADPELAGLSPLPAHEGADFIEWGEALPHRLADLRTLYAALDPVVQATIGQEGGSHGEALSLHALFDALDCYFRPQGLHGWEQWPEAFHDPRGAAAAQFARDNPQEVAFHRFCQWLARTSLDAVQQRAREAGMAVGLLADLAVGVRPGGSDTWTMRGAMLHGLSIGAPPDPLGPHGQNWGLTSFSPQGLKAQGYAPWIALLRNALAHAGGIRIDHAFGLARLWVIPAGGTAADGAYITYPFADLLRLAALEAHRARALVIAEDLGTAPKGFVDAITARRMLGMRVLWFERAADDGFIGAGDYPELSVAMTGTHDTPTVAGWWRGRDLDWAAALGRLPEGTSRQEAESVRDWDRGLLWASLTGQHHRPAPQDSDPVVDAAVAHVARAPSGLAIVPLEDLLGLDEQPNLPGTTVEHPNWRRRMAGPTEALLADPAVSMRIDTLARR
ncbi:4-alpha-glucanotransferase [Alteraurantiacibacter buctensis]|uniref:4-alpha-glucanotransferase n=1 Tax=Alteraurantiacibacter buctensis TaxID=1503981 RepID=UPI00301DEB9E